MGKYLIGLCVGVLFLTACGQKTTFGAAEIKLDNSSSRIVAPDPACGNPDQPPHSIWVPSDAMLGPCPQACADGTTLRCNQMMEREVRCVEGYPTETNNVRPIGQPIQIGTCPILPKDCGNQANGTSWWTEQGVVSRVCDICEDGTQHKCTKAVEVESTCNDGVVSPTGQQRDGRFLNYENVCLPVQPKNCGDHGHGSFWWEGAGTEQADCETCWDGSALKCEYNLEVQKTCNNGEVKNAGFSRRGTLVRTIGQCPYQVKNCGAVPHGGSEWRVNGEGNPYECETCVDGSKRRCVKAKEEQVRCEDGALNLTGLTRDGAFLGYLNECPKDIVERTEVVNATETAGKADVLFILDTTSSMYPNLENLAKGYESLVSGWGRIDWQMAATTAKVEKSLIGRKPLDGKFMPLQTNDKSERYILKKGDADANDIFFRTLSRDKSDRGCSSQPYCMIQPPEPQKTLKRAIDQRNTPTNKGFFRDGAKLVVVIVSDADERENGPIEPKASKPADTVAHFDNVLGKTMDGMIALSVVIKPDDIACYKRNNNAFDMGMAGQYGWYHDRFARLTGGITSSICDADQGPALARLSDTVRQQLESVDLKEVPMAGTLKIEFRPALNATWVLQGKKVIFDRPIPAGTEIGIRYLVKLP